MKNQGVIEDRLVLLKGASGAFRPGVLTALMGVSGAGKTTLMDVLAGRKTGGYIEGSITISGYPKNQETYARISGYCEQNDIHSPHVTIYESLLYSACLRLSREVNSETRKMFIEEVMELVELNLLREALVGLPGVSGLSTEQRKRLTIAVELVANPSIIFMGEPTSGLDARGAAIVTRTVRNIVDTGRTILCTIHQPSIDIFEAFDEEEQSTCSRIEQACSRFQGTSFSYTICTAIFRSMQGLPMETTLAQPSIYCSEIFVHYIRSIDVWDNVLGPRIQNNAFFVQPVVAIERTVFYRERAAGMYSAIPYALAQVSLKTYVEQQTNMLT
ncbi:Putative pleiotropic drug resistance protein 7 [Glycine soja]|uniref:Putative pleiotropic drug resistance protein 7 n=1 Tax=Glycine soja TaxID=3848 RepID=A0A0B2SGK1_GLYSO|nr:Putative pleiotropic drug resistance protein 7 [Glycine soja]